jgi:hypothetical protein
MGGFSTYVEAHIPTFNPGFTLFSGAVSQAHLVNFLNLFKRLFRLMATGCELAGDLVKTRARLLLRLLVVK